ncbi:MAG: helix-turn-helix domain-containing protein [Alphaproteobacteria bacterium]|nr:helix-turn-helix domain-containing protein [Alphaproteobacteria bacterium]
MLTDEVEQARQALESARERYAKAVQALIEANEAKRGDNSVQAYAAHKEASRAKIHERQQQIADARVAILEAIDRYRHDHDIGVRKAVEWAVESFPNRAIPGLSEWVYEAIPKFTGMTIWNWKKAFKEQGIDGLFPSWKGRTKTCLTDAPGLTQFINDTIEGLPNINVADLHKQVAEWTANNDQKCPSVRTIQRMLLKRRSEAL